MGGGSDDEFMLREVNKTRYKGEKQSEYKT